MQTWPKRLALSVIELLIAIGLCVAIVWGTYVLGCAFAKCVDTGAVLWIIIGIPIGVLVGIVFWIAMWRMGTRFRQRWYWDGVAMAIVMGAYLVPTTLARIADARSAAEARDGNRLYEQRRAAWLAAMQSHAHGPPGEVPPMLRAEDRGTVVVVTNASAVRRNVGLAKVLPEATAPGGFRTCEFYYVGSPYSSGPPIPPRQNSRYVLDSACAAEFADAPIEYRVGNYPEEGWWSDSAFATPDGRRREPLAPAATPNAVDKRPHGPSEPQILRMEPGPPR